MISRRTFWLAAGPLAIVGIAVGVALSQVLPIPYRSLNAAVWKDVFHSPAELAQGVDAIVLGTVVGTYPGRVAVSDNGEDHVNFELVEVRALTGVKGVGAEENLLIERASETRAEGRSVFIDSDGGPFEVGRTYLVFLNRQPDSSYYFQVNNQGRYLVLQGRLQAADPTDPVARSLSRRSVAEGLSLVRGYLAAKEPPAES